MKATFFRTLYLALGLFLTIAGFSGCKQLAELTNARDQFNSGVKAENLYLKTDTKTKLNGTNLASAKTHYQAAFDGITEALEDEGLKAKLKKSGGYGYALAIQSLSAWRLKDYTLARTTASSAYEALKNGKVNQPREKALVAALDGFIKLETAYDSMLVLRKHVERSVNQGSLTNASFGRSQQHYTTNIWNTQSGMGYVESAFKTIEDARDNAENEADIQRYLTFAQLTGLKTWSDELQEILVVAKQLRLLGSLEVNGWLTTQNNQFKAEKKRVLDLFAQQVNGGVDNQEYKLWDRTLAAINI